MKVSEAILIVAFILFVDTVVAYIRYIKQRNYYEDAMKSLEEQANAEIYKQQCLHRTRVERNFIKKQSIGLTTGAVEGTRRNWVDRYDLEENKVYRDEIKEDGDLFETMDVTEEYGD